MKTKTKAVKVISKYPDYDNGKVLNIFPCHKTKTVLCLVVPTGVIRVSLNNAKGVKITSTKDVIALIDKHCKKGHISFYGDNAYILPGCTFTLSEVGTNGKMVKLTVICEYYTSMDAAIFDDDGTTPWEPTYILKEVNGTRQFNYNN